MELEVDIEATQRVTHAVLDAITPVLKEFQEAGDKEAMTAAGNTLVMLGTSMLRGQIGHQGAKQILEEIVKAMDGGELSSLFGLPSDKEQ